jgi:hypothetical protein
MGGADGGGGGHLPSAGAGPYRKLEGDRKTPADEPYVVVDDGAILSDPTVLDEGGFDLWFTRRSLAGGAVGPAEIWYAHVPEVSARPDVAPMVVLAASQAWEAGAVSRPSVVVAPDGALVMYYQGGGDDDGGPSGAQPVIGRARSLDRGRTWIDRELLISGYADPAALVVDGELMLFVAAPDGSAILRASVVPGAPPLPVLHRDGAAVQGFDREWLGEPTLVGGRTAAGQLRIALFYVGGRPGGDFAIGYAASSNGLDFLRLSTGTPVLDPGGVDERGPAAALDPDRGWLFFSERRGAGSAIAVATAP